MGKAALKTAGGAPALALWLAAAAAAGLAATPCARGEMANTTTTTTVATNASGIVTKTYVESAVTTNGSFVTERRRETRTESDLLGNLLETATSEYAQSYSAAAAATRPARPAASALPGAEGFLGLRFGDAFDATNALCDVAEPTLLRAPFAPERPLGGFADYYVYVTPATKRVAKVVACARGVVDSEAGARHYLLEALEARYGVRPRLCSLRVPLYVLDVAPDRYVSVCLAGASPDYGTVLSAWDASVMREGAEEWRALREKAREEAAEERARKVRATAEVF